MRQFATIEMARGGCYTITFNYDLPLDMVGAKLFVAIKTLNGKKFEIEAINGVAQLGSEITQELPVGKNFYQVYFLLGDEKYYQCEISTLVVKEVI